MRSDVGGVTDFNFTELKHMFIMSFCALSALWCLNWRKCIFPFWQVIACSAAKPAETGLSRLAEHTISCQNRSDSAYWDGY